jgi:CRISPR-associated protein Cas1
MINEVLYCERLLYLEWAQAEFADNAFTVEGRSVHIRADQPGGKLPPTPRDVAVLREGEPPTGGDLDKDRPYEARTLWLTSERLGITTKIDIVEGTADGSVVPIEYKRGQAPEIPKGAWLPERAQVCAQVLVLREHGYRCDLGEIYFAGSRRRVAIDIDEDLVATTIAAVARAREVTAAAVTPAPLVDSPKCNGCSLVGICLPDEINLLHRSETVGGIADVPAGEGATLEVADEDGAASPTAIRRLHPRNDDQLPLYVQDQGARITLDAECLVVQGRKTPREVVRLSNTSHVALYGNVHLTAQALRALLERNIPVSFLSYGGWYYGRATGCDSKNVELRIAQHRAAANAPFCLRLARGLVASKIRNWT